MARVLPKEPPLVFPIWLVTHRDLHMSRGIRVVFDLLVLGLGAAGVRP